MRYALVDGNQTVVNVIELEDVDAWTAPEGCTLVASETAEPGGAYDGDGFTPAPASPAAPDPDQVLIDAITKATTLADLKAALLGRSTGVSIRGRFIT